jgi:aspartyl-tRNA(Asn)/glutamyl-tRNA(Gln) amidotransferase subunit B
VNYEAVIGLETHVQLNTESKMFCGCAARYADAPPNSHVCPICLGAPGVLPVINERAVQYTIMTGLAFHCRIAEESHFDRKNYPYPDLVKGYQISQYDAPLCSDGYAELPDAAGARRIRIKRIHLEEDTAKLTHARDEYGAGVSLVDVNRAGVPLMEIVSEPDLRTPEEARQYLQGLRLLLTTIGVTTGNLEEGAFRVDVNVSLRPTGSTEYGAKVEVKNLNSFRAVQRALEFEVTRQTAALAAGQTLPQETRGWVDDRGVTVSQRTKESAHDYRYFPEPDLPPLQITAAAIEGLRAALPELPQAREQRLITRFGLTLYEAGVLVADVALAGYYDTLVAAGADPKRGANWLLNDLLGLLKSRDERIDTTRITATRLAALLVLVENGSISTAGARQVLARIAESDDSPAGIVTAEGLAQVSDSAELERQIEAAIDANPKPLADYLGGKEAAFSSFIGPVMKATRGKANPAQVRELLRVALERRR